MASWLLVLGSAKQGRMLKCWDHNHYQGWAAMCRVWLPVRVFLFCSSQTAAAYVTDSTKEGKSSVKCVAQVSGVKTWHVVDFLHNNTEWHCCAVLYIYIYDVWPLASGWCGVVQSPHPTPQPPVITQPASNFGHLTTEQFTDQQFSQEIFWHIIEGKTQSLLITWIMAAFHLGGSFPGPCYCVCWHCLMEWISLLTLFFSHYDKSKCVCILSSYMIVCQNVVAVVNLC